MNARHRPLRRGETNPHGIRGDGELVDERGNVIPSERWSSIAELCRVYEPVRDGSHVIVGFRSRSSA